MSPHLKINTSYSNEENYSALIKTLQSYQCKTHACYRTQNWLFQIQPPCHIMFRLFFVFNLSYSNISSPISYQVLKQMCIYFPQLILSFPCFYRPGNFLTKHYRKFLSLKFHKVWIKDRHLLSEAFVPKTQLLDCPSGDLLKKKKMYFQ